MIYNSVKNPKWGNKDHTIILCDVSFGETLGNFVAFSASPDDMYEHTREIFSRAKNGDFGDVEEYEEASNSLEDLKAQKLFEVKMAFENERANGYIFSESLQKNIDANVTSLTNIQGLVTLMTANGITTSQFRCKDNSFTEVTVEQLKTMMLEIIEFGNSLYNKKWLLESQIDSSITVEEIKSISW